MATTYYYSIGGEIIGESASGQMTTYLTDALGSTIGTIQNGAVVNRFVYNPYGGLLHRSGADSDPAFLWNGGSGYRSTGRSYSERYVHERHYAQSTGQWTTTDPKWPDELQYSYVSGSPVGLTDPSGSSASSARSNYYAFSQANTLAEPEGGQLSPSCVGAALLFQQLLVALGIDKLCAYKTSGKNCGCNSMLKVSGDVTANVIFECSNKICPGFPCVINQITPISFKRLTNPCTIGSCLPTWRTGKYTCSGPASQTQTTGYFYSNAGGCCDGGTLTVEGKLSWKFTYTCTTGGACKA